MCRAEAARHAPEFFDAARHSDPANELCCDGGPGEAEWASVSHGIYLSIAAAGVHRSMGVRTSFVQSTVMDAWKPIHLRMMELGGNRRFSDFLRQHGVPEDAPLREKYATRAAAWYRRNLRAEAEGSDAPEPLAENTGHLPEEERAASVVLDRVFAEAKVDISPRSCRSSKSAPDVAPRRPSRPVLRKLSSKSLPDLASPAAGGSSMSKLVCNSLTYAIRLASLRGSGAAQPACEGPARDAALPSLLASKAQAHPPTDSSGLPARGSGKGTKMLTFAPGC